MSQEAMTLPGDLLFFWSNFALLASMSKGNNIAVADKRWLTQVRLQLRASSAKVDTATAAIPTKLLQKAAKLGLDGLLSPVNTALITSILSIQSLSWVKHIGDSYVADSVGPAPASCRECGHGVKAGLRCACCGQFWHYGCAAASLRGKKAYNILPHGAAFGCNTVDFRCLLCRAPTSAATAKKPLLQRLRSRIESLQPHEMWDVIEDAIAAGPARRRLPGSSSVVRGAAYLATAVVAVVTDMALAGDNSAELLLLFVPRVFFRKGCSIEAQVEAFVRGFKAELELAPVDPHRAWAAAVEGALRDGNWRRATQALLRGPHREAVRAPDEKQVRDFFPDVTAQPDEESNWGRLRARIDAPRKAFGARDLLSWARKHLTTSGGLCGWTGALLLRIAAADDRTFHSMATLWSRHPDEWGNKEAAEVALRATDGWLIPKGEEFRPIAAPQLVRRVGSAFYMKKAKPVAEEYCRRRGQLGLSGEDATIAYSLIPQLCFTTGGTVLVADRSRSFQTFRRDAVFEAVKDVVDNYGDSRPEETAALVDACLEYFAEHGILRRSTVNFREFENHITVNALAQGCSLSPTLEAITLAWAHSKGDRLPHGCLQLTAHDDLVIAAEERTDLTQVVLPDTSVAGGAYNAKKSVAYGPGGSLLRDLGAAAKDEWCGTIWGRAVGDVNEWWRKHWRDRFESKCGRIRELAAVDPALAIWVAHATGGPGQMAQHALRGTPPANCGVGTPIHYALKETDEMWLALLADLTGLTGVSRTRLQLARSAVFGTGLGHLSATEVARAAATAGMAICFPSAACWAQEGGIDIRRWGTALGLPLSIQQGQGMLSEHEMVMCTKHLTEQADAARKELEELRMARKPAKAGGLENLWLAALSPPNMLHDATKIGYSTAMSAESRATVVRAALAKLMGLPISEVLDVGLTVQNGVAVCDLCHVAFASTSTSISASAKPTVTSEHLLQHVAACKKLGATNSNLVRHNALARMATNIARECGVDARVHDGPIFDMTQGTDASRNQRPADWFERGSEVNARDAATFYGGRCVDITIRCGNQALLKQAERDKEKKYAAGMVSHPHLALSVVAINHDGEMSDQAKATVRRWAYHLTNLRRAEADLSGQPLLEVTAAFGFAFATAMARQVIGFAESLTIERGGLNPKAWRPVAWGGRLRGRDNRGAGQGGVKRARWASPQPLAIHAGPQQSVSVGNNNDSLNSGCVTGCDAVIGVAGLSSLRAEGIG